MKKNIEWSYDTIRDEIIHFIHSKYMKESPELVTYEYPLLSNGIIDSLSMMTMILFLEKKFNLDFYLINVKRDDFSSVKTISDLVYSNINSEKENV